MALLARADTTELKTAAAELGEDICVDRLCPPTVMTARVQGRTQDTAKRFYPCAVTVTRCILKVNQEFKGMAWIMGSRPKHCELAALFDGLLQDPRHHDALQIGLLRRLEAREQHDGNRMKSNAARTTIGVPATTGKGPSGDDQP